MSLFNRLFSRSSQKSYSTAMDAYNRGDHETAIVHFQEVLDSASGGSPVYILSRFFVTRCRVHLGHALQEAGRYEEARNVLHTVVKEHPEFPDVHHRLGEIAEQRKLDREAEMRYQRAVEINDRYLEPRLALVLMYRRLGQLPSAVEHVNAMVEAGLALPESWVAGTAEEDTPERIEDLRRQVGTSGRSIEEFEDGIKRYHAGDLTGALRCFDTAVESAPRHPDIRCRRGTVLGELGRFDDALGEFNEALELNPNYEEAQIKRGVTLFQMGRCAEAAVDFEAVVASGVSNAELLLLLGASLLRSGRVDDAIPHLNEARDDESASARATYFLAQAYVQADRPDLAIECLESSKAAVGLSLLGRLYLNRRRFHDTIRILGRARSAGDKSGDVALCLAEAHYSIGDPDRAKRYAEDALQTDGTWNRATFLLARMSFDSGEDKQVLSWLKRLHADHGLDYDVQLLSGRSLGRLGRLVEGRTALEKALELRPGEREAQRALGLLLRRSGEGETASRLLAEARRDPLDPLWSGFREGASGSQVPKAA